MLLLCRCLLATGMLSQHLVTHEELMLNLILEFYCSPCSRALCLPWPESYIWGQGEAGPPCTERPESTCGSSTHRYRAPMRVFVTLDICTRNRWPSVQCVTVTNF